MALPPVGSTISLSDIQAEYGGSNPISLSEYYGKGNAPSSGAITMSADFGGTQDATSITSSVQEMTVSSYISSGETMVIESGVYIWSNSTSTAGMTINIPCTIINNGYIIGRGGDGSYSSNNGGPAINVTSSGVTIVNNSGAFIAGGGGSGGRGRNGAGGGGAGGGNGGGPNGGSGGSIGNAGSSGSGSGSGGGGGAGGGGMATTFGGTGGSGGGGRILPGTGGSGGGGTGPGGAGGSGGNNGSTAPNVGGDMGGGGGGGGWGASGGTGYYPTSSAHPGGAGGAAITGTSRTLTNNGTIFGST